MTEPTGNELYAQAEALYFDYRDVVNGVLSAVSDEPWKVEGLYGMEPSEAGCRGGWNFTLGRMTTVDPASHDELRQSVADYLTGAGFEVQDEVVGAGDPVSEDVVVTEQGDFSSLRATFVSNGNVLVTASTRCMPGDVGELDTLLFDGVTVAEGYLPTSESPSDPLFFGVTPGEPGFLPTPTATP